MYATTGLAITEGSVLKMERATNANVFWKTVLDQIAQLFVSHINNWGQSRAFSASYIRANLKGSFECLTHSCTYVNTK